MTRWFYTDPLAAAWMAKHFGMKIGQWLDADIFASFEITSVSDIHASMRFYIHPDSQPLLEPRKGDLIQDNVDHEFQVVWCDEKGLGIDTSKGTMSPAGMVIIQRGGKPFIWPEQEAV